MNDENGRSPGRLRSVRGGAEEQSRADAPAFTIAPEDDPPFRVDAVVVEDDTYAVLGADPEYREPTEHPLRIWTAVHETEPADPGTVSVQSGEPLRLLAVVHDLSQDPTWKEEWVTSALAEILRHVERLGLKSIGLPVLGAVHGKLPVERFVTLLRDALEAHRPTTLEHLWLISRKGDIPTFLAELLVMSDSE